MYTRDVHPLDRITLLHVIAKIRRIDSKKMYMWDNINSRSNDLAFKELQGRIDVQS